MTLSLRSATIAESRDHSSRLTYYAPGVEQAEHQHEASQVSILLLGSLRETVQCAHRDIAAPYVCLKPEGTVHSNRFGRCGALVLSIRFERGTDQREIIRRKGWGWARMQSTEGARQFAARGSSTELCRILADASPEDGRGPPDWLGWVRASLDAHPARTSIADLAKQADVHRVHLTRCFNEHYGMSPSKYRLRLMAAIALERMMHGRVSAAAAAADAGFADQSHMARTIRQATALTPRQIIRALA